MEGYALTKLGMSRIVGHPEFFLEFSHTDMYFNTKTQRYDDLELYPIPNDNRIDMHFIYPHVFNNSIDRIRHKMNVLKHEKDNGRDYYFKGTMNIFDSYQEIIDFFADRKIIITRRHDIVEMAISYLYARNVKLFHAKGNNYDYYTSVLAKGTEINESELEDMPEYIKYLTFVDNVEHYIKDKNYNYCVTYYEDMETDDMINSKIDEIYETTEWRNSVKTTEASTPIKVEKKYSNVIKNYTDVRSHLENIVKEIRSEKLL
jgi:hypothetical protein